MRYEGSPIGYDVLRLRDVMVPARDGVRLATDLYVPAHGGQRAPGRFPTLLERTPYDKNAPGMVGNGRYFARRGYVCAVQDVRGRFASEGEWYPFAHEAPDGFDAVEWLAGQEWSDGQVGTMGGSYSGSDQSALATLNPPHLRTMVVAVGASNYHHCSMRHNGALEQRFLVYAFRMATTSKRPWPIRGCGGGAEGGPRASGEWVARAPLRAGASPSASPPRLRALGARPLRPRRLRRLLAPAGLRHLGLLRAARGRPHPLPGRAGTTPTPAPPARTTSPCPG